jgi:predicted nucleotidyltransferase
LGSETEIGKMQMRHKKSSDSQKISDGELNVQQSSNLGLPQTLLSTLNEILTIVSSNCYSVILCGSWAEGTSMNQSDLDLLFITQDEIDKNATMAVLGKTLSETSKSVFDCTVLTTDDIKRMSKGPQHFGVRFMLTKGIVLYGYDVSDLFKFEYEKVRILINDLLERINDCLSSLESNIRYTGICVQSAYIARTLYFVDKHLLKMGHHPELKHEYLEKLLGPQYITIERIYYEVALSRKSLSKLEVIPRVQTRKEPEYSQRQYEELYNVCVKLERAILDIRFQLQSRLDLP